MKTLREINPEAAEMWAYDLNGELTPDTVSGQSETTAYFRCLDNSKHLFAKKVCKMTSYRDGHNVGCIYCGPNVKVAFPGETDFFTQVPASVDMWDFAQNDLLGLNPKELLPSSHKKAHFLCANGHDEFRKIVDFTKSPSCQICRKSLLVNAPNTTLFLNEKYNTEENVKDYIQSDRRLIELACPNCDYTWSWEADLWRKRQYCPHCGYDGTKGSCEKNSFVKEMYHIVTLRDANPEMAALWDYKKNGDATPDNTNGQSTFKFFFSCKNGHKFSREPFKLYDKDGNPQGCPFCKEKTRIIAEGINDLATKVPEILEFWDYENNDVSPGSISSGSVYEAKLICPKGHHFTQKVCLFVADPQCTECKRLEHLPKYSIKNSRPESYRFWDFEKNTLDPSVTSATSKEVAFWKCPDCGYEWTQKICDRYSSRGGKCPSHDLKRVRTQAHGIKSAESFAHKNPEASKYWNIELSNGLTPENTSKGSGRQIYMNCSRRKHNPYPVAVYTIKKAPYGCPECLKEDLEENYKKYSLKLNVPSSIEMWDYENNEISLDDAKIYMSKSVNFICSKGHHFSRSLRVFARNQDCPICKLNAVVKYPHLIKQWDFERNTEYDINLTSANSETAVWWRCKKCSYKWQSKIVSRKFSAGHCPCCEERTVVVKGITDLFTLVPDIKEFYDFEANKDINPYELSVTSLTPVNWKCSICGYKWCTSASARIIVDDEKYKVKRCPACAGQVRTKSYGEEYPDLASRFKEEMNHCSLYDLIESKYCYKQYYWHCNICGEIFESTVDTMIAGRSSPFKGCSYCAGKKVLRKNSFAALHPEIMDEFDPDNEIDPYTVAEKSSKNAKWICRNNPEHRWIAQFNARANGQGGCKICRDYNYELKFSEEHGEFEQYYDTEKNERPFSSYSNRSNERVWWKCNADHSFKWSILNFSNTGNFKCPICENKQLLVGENDLKSKYPEFAQEFDAVKNNMLPENILYTSRDDSIWWICKEGHSYQQSVWYRINYTSECPICSFKLIQPGINSLLDTDEELARELSPNEPQKPYELYKYSKYRALWKCPTCHGEYSYLICERKVGDDSCPYCNNRRPLEGFNTLETVLDDIESIWGDSNDKAYTELLPSSSYYAKWKCRVCGGLYNESVYTFIPKHLNGEDDCPYCNVRKPMAGFNTLETVLDDIKSIWSDSNLESYTELLPASGRSVKWVCGICGGQYSEQINKYISRYLNGENDCPYCNNKKPLAGFNTLETVLDDIESIWSDSNLESYTELLPTSRLYVEWVCGICGGQYSERINKYISKYLNGENNCPYCNNKKPLAGFNTLKVKCENLMREWNYRSNYLIANPDAILPTSSQEVWWTCECSKNYKMSPKKRLYYLKRHMKACPYCKGRRRKKHRHF